MANGQRELAGGTKPDQAHQPAVRVLDTASSSFRRPRRPPPPPGQHLQFHASGSVGLLRSMSNSLSRPDTVNFLWTSSLRLQRIKRPPLALVFLRRAIRRPRTVLCRKSTLPKSSQRIPEPSLSARRVVKIVCAVQRRASSAGSNPARQLSFQPVAIGVDVAVSPLAAPSKSRPSPLRLQPIGITLISAKNRSLLSGNALPIRRYASRAPAVLCPRIGLAGAINFAIACRGGHF
jgi:hypothetical protein